ncbi:MAG: V-type ATPase 116kDa subunit family protein, partial [Halovenus sp.]
MLRPEQMSKVSITGAKPVMDDVIETLHEMNLVHITDYDGSWEGFSPGDSLEGADEVSSQLVTVRAIENILDIDEGDVSPSATADLTNAEERLEEIRTEVNELDERRDEFRDRLRDIDERLEQMELFADLGIDLDLLWGYDTLDVLVGEGNPDRVTEALAAVEAFEVVSGDESVAAFAKLAEEETISDVLVGVPFTAVEVPEETGDPESNIEELERERQQVEAELDKVENELEALKHDTAPFLLALEERLTIEAEKSEAPLRFATTERSFIVEGWVPSERYDELAATLEETLGDRVEITELRQASYTGPDGPGSHGDEAAATDGGTGAVATDDEQVATDGGDSVATVDEQVATDGGDNVVTVDDDPPVVQKNSSIVNPFEVIVKAVNRPKYSELDPTITLFLTFPLFFGFMIGDIGYGVVYILIGWVMYRRFTSESVSNLGAVIVWMGLWTVLFGGLYGEIFGLHFLEWFGAHPVLEKGIGSTEWALTWLIVAVIAGWIHLNIGYVFEFIEELELHGIKPAILETGSWILMLNGLWVFIFSKFLDGSKPPFFIGPDALLNDGPLGFGFTGFPEVAGMVGLVAFGVGIVLLLLGPWYDVFEFVVPLSHTLSYTRLTAVLLAKAGMAVAANLLYFGAYQDEEGFHYIHSSTPGAKEAAGENVVFGGLSNMGTEM